MELEKNDVMEVILTLYCKEKTLEDSVTELTEIEKQNKWLGEIRRHWEREREIVRMTEIEKERERERSEEYNEITIESRQVKI